MSAISMRRYGDLCIVVDDRLGPRYRAVIYRGTKIDHIVGSRPGGRGGNWRPVVIGLPVRWHTSMQRAADNLSRLCRRIPGLRHQSGVA